MLVLEAQVSVVLNKELSYLLLHLYLASVDNFRWLVIIIKLFQLILSDIVKRGQSFKISNVRVCTLLKQEGNELVGLLIKCA